MGDAGRPVFWLAPMAAFHSFPGNSQWLHERRVAHSCWAAPVLHRIPEHLTAVSAADASAALMAVVKAFGKGGTPQPPLSGGLFFLPPLPEGIAFYPPAKGGFFSYPLTRGGVFFQSRGASPLPPKIWTFQQSPLMAKLYRRACAMPACAMSLSIWGVMMRKIPPTSRSART